MVKKDYIPDRGDLVWLNFNPQSGHEQAGLRPALVVSPKEYSKISGLSLVCPITSKPKNFIFELPLKSNCKINGVILVDQVRSVDFKSRKLHFVSKVDIETLKIVQAYLVNLITEEV